jgi:hypothetical protein
MKKNNNYKKILSKKNQKWFINFYKKLGRSPRVLHIGNIANNAYNNAKIMNEAGINSDVLCYDYYHIMSNPEWEDADFSKFPSDDFFPNWTKSKIENFDRPKWFVQGPLKICLAYLDAKKDQKKIKTNILWFLLSLLNGTSVINLTGFIKKIREFKRSKIITNIKLFFKIVFSFFKIAKGEIILFFIKIVKGVHIIPIVIIIFYRIVNLKKDHLSINTYIIKAYKKAKKDQRKQFKKLRKIFLSKKKKIDISKKEQIIQEQKEEFTEQFPDQKNFLRKNFYNFFNFNLLKNFKKIFEHYDLIISYSIDPIIPMTCDIPYFSFEHGTLRDIPYEKSGRANLTSLAYRKSIHTFVTNFDCKKSANYLTQGKFTIINHPYDEDSHLQDNNYKLARKDLLKKLDSDFLFFHPTRHDWVKGKGFADKDNDKFLNAFINLRSKGFRIGLIACDWGNNVKQSKKILNRFEKHVHWLKPMGSYKFRSMCKTCDIVVDQFKLGSFGGIVFKSLACGSPVLTYLNKKEVKKQYKVTPPVINCKTQKEIEINIKKILLSPKQLKVIRLKSRRWVKKFHGKVETVNKQVNQFRLNY